MSRTNRPIYLDNHATTPVDPRVLAAMRPWWEENFANPGSAEHAMGRAAEEAVEAARGHVAELIGAASNEVVLTSGATESNNLAIKGAARHAASQGTERRRVVTLATEHKCVLESVRDLAAEGFEPVILPVRPDGLLDLDILDAALTAAPTLLVSVMAVNNEVGVIQDLAAIGEVAKRHGALFHTDAAQAAGRVPLDVEEMRADLLSLSGHKLYGPKGVGALYVRRRPRVRLAPLFSGGGQERGLRSGTTASSPRWRRRCRGWRSMPAGGSASPAISPSPFPAASPPRRSWRRRRRSASPPAPPAPPPRSSLPTCCAPSAWRPPVSTPP